MLSRVARVEIKVAESYIAEINVLFSLICWSSLEPLNVYIYVYRFLAMMLKMFVIPSLKVSYSRNAQICNKIDALEGSCETASATALFSLEKGESFYPKRHFPDI